MTFLPIVERELRVGARRRVTFWGRVSAAGLALGIALLLQLFFLASRGGLAAQAGLIQFTVLSWLSFAFACGAGIFLTSDTLSEEKREGTLGLLFLTDLRGYDVVLGKLITGSVQAFYALLAAFPILALSLLQGGVTVRQFWLAVLVICHTLFLSLAIGLFVSSVSRDSQRSMNGVVLALFLLLAVTPLADAAMAGWNPASFVPRFSLASPGNLFVGIGRARLGDFWLRVGLQQGLAWALLGLACYFTPRAWQEKARRWEASARRIEPGQLQARARRRSGTLERNPVLWLASRDRWQRRLLWSGHGVRDRLGGVAVLRRRREPDASPSRFEASQFIHLEFQLKLGFKLLDERHRQLSAFVDLGDHAGVSGLGALGVAVVDRVAGVPVFHRGSAQRGAGADPGGAGGAVAGGAGAVERAQADLSRAGHLRGAAGAADSHGADPGTAHDDGQSFRPSRGRDGNLQ